MIPASNLIISIRRRELCMTSKSSSSNLVMWNHFPHRKFIIGNILEHRNCSWELLSTIVAGRALSSSSLAPVVINRQSSVSLVASVLASGGRCRFSCLKKFPLRIKLHWKHSHDFWKHSITRSSSSIRVVCGGRLCCVLSVCARRRRSDLSTLKTMHTK